VGSDAFIKVCDADQFDRIITDWECLEEQVAALEEKGIAVTVVEETE
jgi:DeoR/GlpR family transcriptional regulator of sugar metabolism